AYGFKTRQALADHIGVSKSTLANRYMRDTFPADWIIQCSLETGASLTWLTTGNGAMFEKPRINTITIPYHKIIDGSLAQETVLTFDSKLLEGTFLQPLAVFIDEEIYIVESKFNEVTDGKWLVNIEGKISIKDLTRIPVGMVKVVGTNASFECLLTDIIVLAKCKRVFTKNV
ncbi:phage repressor protein CI, partial [Klebsiella pneumoniae]